MKYMGSKRVMLANGLGTTLLDEIGKHDKGFVDLFSGSGAVAHFVATKTTAAVTAVDLQLYSRELAASIIERTLPVDTEAIWSAWVKRASTVVGPINLGSRLTVKAVKEMRDRCSSKLGKPITSAYGGHYFSEQQALWFDALLETVPPAKKEATLCRAALIAAASKCAASPGHTAQPLQPTRSSLVFISKAWSLDPRVEVKNVLERIGALHAHSCGTAVVEDANAFAWQLKPRQVVFIDPPYSAVQYSRFYHVLETIARHENFDPSGSGRYPPVDRRPRSLYSMKGEAFAAMSDLFLALSEAQATCVITYPNHDCSNGLSGAQIEEIALNFFRIDRKLVKSTFSTLGGNSRNDETVPGRAARHEAEEMILVLRPS